MFHSLQVLPTLQVSRTSGYRDGFPSFLHLLRFAYPSLNSYHKTIRYLIFAAQFHLFCCFFFSHKFGYVTSVKCSSMQKNLMFLHDIQSAINSLWTVTRSSKQRHYYYHHPNDHRLQYFPKFWRMDHLYLCKNGSFNLSYLQAATIVLATLDVFIVFLQLLQNPSLDTFLEVWRYQ